MDRRVKYTGNLKGITQTRFYKIWCDMKSRCSNSNELNYHNYGGKGVKVCSEWLDFINFYKDMYSSYKEHLTIDRIDSNKNYCKENCRWATYKEQARNMKTNRIITYNGRSMIMKDWALELGIKYKTLAQRINGYKWSYERALETGGNYFGS